MKGMENIEGQTPEEVLEKLFRNASARERPPTGDEQAIREALHSQWRVQTRRRYRRRVMISLAAAASVVLAVFLGSNLLRSPQPPVPAMQLAAVEKVLGGVFVHPAGDGPVLKAEYSMAVETGQQIVTGRDSRLALKWADGASVRLDQNSEVRFSSTGEIVLISGRLYVDTETADETSLALVILTPAGPVRHLGTQYMTQVSARNTSVTVRKGQISLGQPGVEILAVSGEQLNVDVSGVHSRRAVPGYGDLWQWTQDLAPAFVSDGQSITDFLGWVGRESGRAVAFASPQAEQLAGDTLLRGNVNLEPMRALTVMLQTTDLVSEVNSGTIVVALRK
jgi:ferric-dicitrate binding protein FerR (iron transport regulator)